MKDKLINIKTLQGISPVFKQWYGPLLAKCVISLAGFDKVNRVYDAGKSLTGPAVEDAMLDNIGVVRKVYNIDVLRQFDGKPFITVSNHPYGHIDGIFLVGEITRIRMDFKVMVNWMLGLIDSMAPHFIGVNPYSADVSSRSSLGGVRQCLEHLKAGHPLGFFPAGAMSMFDKNREVHDQPWQEGVLKLIKKAGVPVIPAYFSGKNSWLFYFLERINWRIRTVRLCHELDNKCGKTINLIFGQPIMPDEQLEYEILSDFGVFLANRTYQLKSLIQT
ncbi:MAG: 1-acyl-sn-glycerol-3-phosphate acyltransferase [Dysgonamonadaceae bacterium]|jgi:1-acyl-sn-glycerol-3-phosphate acyltransferase|nr:1-acyl-sn-glycerol-3-phosphate acyltransferase [Dysgonamonadaceae bacterium]